MLRFSPTLPAFRDAVDAELHRFLDAKRGALSHSEPLIDEMSRMVAAGGKRLRPAFCYWGYRAAGGEHGAAILRAASALELLHTFAIVHDDIMDASDERRGAPTVHALHGIEVALLVGDLALVLADDMFMASGFGPSELTGAFEGYSRMRQQVIVGQYLDLEAARDGLVDESHARRVARLKSGRYSIEEPLTIGARLAGAAQDVLASLRRFGAPLGEAFQLRDDLLGTFGERSSVGKPVDSDIREGKRHVLFAKTAGALQGRDRAFFLEKWGRGSELGPDEVERLRSLIEASGARAETEGLLRRLTEEARASLAALRAPDEPKRALRALVDVATARRA